MGRNDDSVRPLTLSVMTNFILSYEYLIFSAFIDFLSNVISPNVEVAVKRNAVFGLTG